MGSWPRLEAWRDKLGLGLLGIYVAAVYWPYVRRGGFVNDDWWVLHFGMQPGAFLDVLANYYPHNAGRPVAGLVWTAAVGAFGLAPTGYILVNTLLWMGAMALLARVLWRSTSSVVALVFLALASTPSFTSSSVFFPVTALVPNTSLLLWALSLHWLAAFCRTGRVLAWSLHFTCLVLALFTYEAVASLMVLNLALPWVIGTSRPATGMRERWSNYLRLFAWPPLAAAAVLMCWQKLLAPQLFGVVGSVRAQFPHSFYAIYNPVVDYVLMLLLELPELLYRGAERAVAGWPADHVGVLALLLLLLLAAMAAMRRAGGAATTPTPTPDKESAAAPARVDAASLRWLFLSSIGLVTAVALFVLSASYTVISVTGYWNRLLPGCLILLMLMLANAASRWPGQPVALLVLLMLAGLNAQCFLWQRDDFIASRRIQQVILDDVAQRRRQAGVVQPVSLLAAVPRFIVPNFNDVMVFNSGPFRRNPGTLWDFSMALGLTSPGFADQAKTLSRDELQPGVLHITPGAAVFALQGAHYEGQSSDGSWRADYSRLWYYRYDLGTGQSSLLPVASAQTMRDIVDQLPPAQSAVSDQRLSRRAKQWLVDVVYTRRRD